LMHPSVRANGFLPRLRTAKPVRGVNADAGERPDDIRRHPDGKDVRMVIFIQKRPLWHPWRYEHIGHGVVGVVTLVAHINLPAPKSS
jgi:hypothetical protein